MSLEVLWQNLTMEKVEEILHKFLPRRLKRLRMVGGKLSCLCPRHWERKSSFFIFPSKRSPKILINCFGCGYGSFESEGRKIQRDFLDFLSDMMGKPLWETAMALAKELNIEDSINFSSLRSEKKQKVIISPASQAESYSKGEKRFLEACIRYFWQYAWVDSSFIKNLFKAQRESLYERLNHLKQDHLEAIRGCRIGLGPLARQRVKLGGIKAWLDRARIFYEPFLEEADKMEKFFAGKVVFPVFEDDGNFSTFRARSVNKKSFVSHFPLNRKKPLPLYGLHLSRESIKSSDEAVIVEGEFDFFALRAAGILNCCALMGTNITPYQIRVLRKYTSNFKFMLDGDFINTGGAVNFERIARIIGKLSYIDKDIKPSFVLLPDNLDPEDFFKSYKAAELKKLLSSPLVPDESLTIRAIVQRYRKNPGRMGLYKRILEIFGFPVPDKMKLLEELLSVSRVELKKNFHLAGNLLEIISVKNHQKVNTAKPSFKMQKETLIRLCGADDLSDPCVMLFLFLKHRQAVSPSEKLLEVKLSYLSSRSGLSIRQIQRHLKSLEARKFITFRYKHGKRSLQIEFNDEIGGSFRLFPLALEEEGCLLKMKNFVKLWIRAKLMQRTDTDSVAGKLSKRVRNLSSSTLMHKIRNLRKNGFLYEFKDTKGRDRFIVLTMPNQGQTIALEEVF